MRLNGTIPLQDVLARLAPLRDQFLQLRPDSGHTISLDAFLQISQDPGSIDLEDVITKIIAAIERDPNDVRVYVALTAWLNAFGREDESIEWLQRALIIDPLDFMLHWQLGNLLGSRGDSEAEIEAFKKVTELNPQWPSGHSSLAWAEFEAGDPVVWYQEFRVAAALDPLDYEMEVGTAEGFMNLGLYEESSRHAARASKMNAANGGEWQYSSLLSLIGDPEQSRILTESFLRSESTARFSGFGSVVWAYVSVSIEAGKSQEALAVIEEIFPGSTAEDLVPTSMDEFFVQFWVTVAWAQGKETSEVVARLDELALLWDATDPDWRTWSTGSSTIAFLRGDLEEAARIAEERLRGNYGDSAFRYHYLYPLNVIAAEPAVAARLAEIEEEIRPRREALQAYIEEIE